MGLAVLTIIKIEKQVFILGMMLICCQSASASFYICTNCTDCTNKINAAERGSTVYLTYDINSTEDCIKITDGDGIIFDCQDYSIRAIGPCSQRG